MTNDDVETLLSAMTLAEKIGQLTMAAGAQAVTGPVAGGALEADARAGRVGSVLNLWGADEVASLQQQAVEGSRLKTPLVFAFDVIHGHRSIFPIPLAETCAFDPDLWERTAAAAAAEARQDGIDLVFAPMIDVARDPRWGRIAEGPGEDPYVASVFAAAKIRGFQGDNLADPSKVAACAKHFCAYGAAEAGRDYASADVSERTLREVYAPPFAAAVAAGCASVMPAFMDLAGVPMSAHEPLIQGWLRREQGYDGVVVSDYNAVAELMAHGVAADRIEAAALALNAGIDVDMMSFCYRDGLPAALERGLVSMAAVDAAARRVLRLKARLGLFQRFASPAVVSRPPAGADLRGLALEAARASIVILANDGVLPLAAATRRIALVGPLADAACEMDGPWAGAGAREAAVSIRQGLAALRPDMETLYAEGVPIAGEDESGVEAALAACRDADVIVLCLGEAATMSGEAASRTALGLPGRQRAFAEAALDLAAAAEKPVVALLCCGRPLVVPWLFSRADAVVAAWFPGEAAGTAIAEALFGRFNPSGRLPASWPRAEGQIPVYFAQRPTGRPFEPGNPYSSGYLDCAVEPRFPFGHGLSYSAFAMRSFGAETQSFRRGDTLRFRVEIRNDGPFDGATPVFLFARDLVASVARPRFELKRFGRIALGAGESGTLMFSLPAEELTFLGRGLTPVFEPGGFEFYAGFSADPAALLRLRCEALA